MRKVLLLGLVGMLCVAAPASAAATLTVHRAKAAVTRGFLGFNPDAERSSMKTACRRTSARRMLCTVTQREAGPACYEDEPWAAQLARDGSFVSVVPRDDHYRIYGDCATVTLTPVDGDVSTSTP